MQTISSNDGGAIRDIFGRSKALIGMIHCPPFPGSPRYRGESMAPFTMPCLRDADALISNGMHGLIVKIMATCRSPNRKTSDLKQPASLLS